MTRERAAAKRVCFETWNSEGISRRGTGARSPGMPPDATKQPQGDGDAGGEESVSEEVSKEVFRNYQCSSIAEGRGRDHPGEIAEAGSLR
jgi:hypothetical protein